MQSLANKPLVSPQSRIPQSLLDRFENEWREMRAASETAPRPIPAAK
ncbi:hypothetical protein [Sinorhizobium glycinis]|nr:hypothetical protein [Sinorhizobium glycinis]